MRIIRQSERRVFEDAILGSRIEVTHDEDMRGVSSWLCSYAIHSFPQRFGSEATIFVTPSPTRSTGQMNDEDMKGIYTFGG